MGYSAGALPSSCPQSKVVDGAAANMRERKTHYFAVAGVEDHLGNLVLRRCLLTVRQKCINEKNENHLMIF